MFCEFNRLNEFGVGKCLGRWFKIVIYYLVVMVEKVKIFNRLKVK